MSTASRFRQFDSQWLEHRISRDENDCWIWQPKARTEGGYGRLRYDKKYYVAHCFVYMQLVGPIPEWLKILHTCDVRLCVNPEHLFLGTEKDNALDMILKERHRNNQGGDQLPWSVVLEIRELHRQGLKQVDIANRYKLSRYVVGRIVRDEAYQGQGVGISPLIPIQ